VICEVVYCYCSTYTCAAKKSNNINISTTSCVWERESEKEEKLCALFIGNVYFVAERAEHRRPTMQWRTKNMLQGPSYITISTSFRFRAAFTDPDNPSVIPLYQPTMSALAYRRKIKHSRKKERIDNNNNRSCPSHSTSTNCNRQSFS
jgi:hypothetical protein